VGGIAFVDFIRERWSAGSTREGERRRRRRRRRRDGGTKSG